ncbi:helix-turn-helix domain-containing protein (plasmid) [Streptomyces sp. NBC_01463]
MDQPSSVGPAAAYAATLRSAVADFVSHGGTQREIAKATQIAPATLSRYLSGDRIAPPHFLQMLETFLATAARPMPAAVRTQLEDLCGRAHEASRSPAVQLVYLREELAQVKGEKEATEQELEDLTTHAQQLTEELEAALEQARTAQSGQIELRARVGEQDQHLADAQNYARQLEAELTEQRDEALRLQREIKTLRGQNRRLIEESTTRSEKHSPETVSSVSTQATGQQSGKEGTSQRASSDASGSSSAGSRSSSSAGSQPLLGTADTREELFREMQALRERAGGRHRWTAERLASASPGLDPKYAARWFDEGKLPHLYVRDWKRILRALGATAEEVNAFHASFKWITRPAPRAPRKPIHRGEAAIAALALGAVCLIWVTAAGVFDTSGPSWIAKSLTALGALVTSLVVWAVGVFAIASTDEQHSDAHFSCLLFAAPLAAIACIVIPLTTDLGFGGHWLADLCGLL